MSLINRFKFRFFVPNRIRRAACEFANGSDVRDVRDAFALNDDELTAVLMWGFTIAEARR